MLPTAAVSGWYFSHPEAKYFNTDKIEKDQVESLAKRKGVSVEEIEKWLSPVLSYEPSAWSGYKPVLRHSRAIDVIYVMRTNVGRVETRVVWHII